MDIFVSWRHGQQWANAYFVFDTTQRCQYFGSRAVCSNKHFSNHPSTVCLRPVGVVGAAGASGDVLSTRRGCPAWTTGRTVVASTQTRRHLNGRSQKISKYRNSYLKIDVCLYSLDRHGAILLDPQLRLHRLRLQASQSDLPGGGEHATRMRVHSGAPHRLPRTTERNFTTSIMCMRDSTGLRVSIPYFEARNRLHKPTRNYFIAFRPWPLQHTCALDRIVSTTTERTLRASPR